MNTTTSTISNELWKPAAPYVTMGAAALMFVAIATVNVLILVVMVLNPRLQTIPNMYIGALAVSDLAVSFNQLLAIPWTSPKYHVQFEENASLCLFFKCFVYINELTSIFIIAAIGVDRYLYIHHAFWYLRIITKRKVIMTVVIVWCLSIIIALSFRLTDSGSKFAGCDHVALLYDSEMAGYFNAVLFFTICFVLFVSYGIVMRSAVRHARAIRSMVPRIVTTFVSTEGEALHVHQEKVKSRSSLKIVQRMVRVVLVLFVCWTPYALIGLIGPKKVNEHIVLISAFLASFNSAANVGVYALGDRDFRLATFGMLNAKRISVSAWHSVSTTMQPEHTINKSICSVSRNGQLILKNVDSISIC